MAGGDKEGDGSAFETWTGRECRRRGFAASSRGNVGEEGAESSVKDVLLRAGVSPLEAVGKSIECETSSLVTG